MISIDKIQIRGMKYNDLFPAICESLNELYTLSGKFKDVEQIKIFASALTKELPVKYPYLTIEQLKQIFNNAIMGEYGDIKTIALPDIFKWLRKWQDGAKNGNVIESLASPESTNLDLIDWSREVYKAYARFMESGLTTGQFSHLLYERLQMDNFIPLEGYRNHIEKSAKLLGVQPDIMNEQQRNLAKRYAVLEVFERLKNQGRNEIYGTHK